MKELIFALICLWGGMLSPLFAQNYRFEAGMGVGISSAYGDINQSSIFYKPQIAVEAHFRYQYNLRWAFTGDLLSAGLQGDSRDFSNRFPGDAHYRFKNRLWQLTGNAEFHFFNYGLGAGYRNMSRISPFISVGMGLGLISGDNTAFSFTLPLGAGVKYKLAPRWGIALKLVFAKSFTDKADGVDDPYGIESSTSKNTDWYSMLNVSVSYEFGLRKRKCNNLD